jgi:hypothetical protein
MKPVARMVSHLSNGHTLTSDMYTMTQLCTEDTNGMRDAHRKIVETRIPAVTIERTELIEL